MSKIPASRQLILSVFLLLSINAPAREHAPKADVLCSQIQTIVREGDLVFTEPYGRLSEPLALTLGSWVTHVGIVVTDRPGHFAIAEAVVRGTRLWPLCTFAHRSFRDRVAIHRLARPLLETEITQLRASIQKRIGTRYDLGFNYDGPGQYCSKLVHDVFLEAANVEIGRIVTFQDVLKASPNKYMVKFWSVWFGHSIPWSRRTITPPSVRTDPALVQVFAHHLEDAGP